MKYEADAAVLREEGINIGETRQKAKDDLKINNGVKTLIDSGIAVGDLYKAFGKKAVHKAMSL